MGAFYYLLDFSVLKVKSINYRNKNKNIKITKQNKNIKNINTGLISVCL